MSSGARFGERYLGGQRPAPDVELPNGTKRLLDSVWHLVDHIGDVPVHVIPCIEGRTDGKGVPQQASRFGTIVPAVWSFMLAARARGLGTCWTTFHLAHEEEAAELLGIPYAEVMQVALIPVAYTLGTEFRPARRKPLERWCTGTPGSAADVSGGGRSRWPRSTACSAGGSPHP